MRLGVAVLLHQLAERLDAFDTHDVVKPLAGMGEVLADRCIHLDAAGLQFVVHHAFEQRRAAAAAGAGFGGTFNAAKVSRARVDGTADAAFGHIVAGADHRRFRQGIRPQRRCSTALLRQNERCGFLRQLDAVGVVLQQRVIHTVIAHQHGPQQLLTVAGDDQFAVDLSERVEVAEHAGARILIAVGIANRADIHAQQF